MNQHLNMCIRYQMISLRRKITLLWWLKDKFNGLVCGNQHNYHLNIEKRNKILTYFWSSIGTSEAASKGNASVTNSPPPSITIDNCCEASSHLRSKSINGWLLVEELVCVGWRLLVPKKKGDWDLWNETTIYPYSWIKKKTNNEKSVFLRSSSQPGSKKIFKSVNIILKHVIMKSWFEACC